MRHRAPRFFQRNVPVPAIAVASPTAPQADPSSLPAISPPPQTFTIASTQASAPIAPGAPIAETPISAADASVGSDANHSASADASLNPSAKAALDEFAAADLVDAATAHRYAREAEHARQRTLRKAERARHALAVVRGGSRSRSRHSERGEIVWERAEVEKDAGAFWAGVWVAAGGAELGDADPNARGRREKEGAREVKLVDLADLVRPARGGKKAKENDFELVPRVRAVIVLDELDAPDLGLGDEWEYVSSVGAGDDEPRTVLSYAEVVARKTT